MARDPSWNPDSEVPGFCSREAVSKKKTAQPWGSKELDFRALETAATYQVTVSQFRSLFLWLFLDKDRWCLEAFSISGWWMMLSNWFLCVHSFVQFTLWFWATCQWYQHILRLTGDWPWVSRIRSVNVLAIGSTLLGTYHPTGFFLVWFSRMALLRSRIQWDGSGKWFMIWIKKRRGVYYSHDLRCFMFALPDVCWKPSVMWWSRHKLYQVRKIIWEKVLGGLGWILGWLTFIDVFWLRRGWLFRSNSAPLSTWNVPVCCSTVGH